LITSAKNVATITDAQHSRDAYLEIFERIAQEGLHANVSGKLTQLGLDINIEYCEGLVRSIVERAASFDTFCVLTWKVSFTRSALSPRQTCSQS